MTPPSPDPEAAQAGTTADAADRWTLERLLAEVVGSGPRSADDMTRVQATAAFERVLSGAADPVRFGAFMLANRWKTNTPEELAAFVDAIRRRARTATPSADPVDCGANYDGKTGTAVLGVAAGLVAAAAGTPVVVHSADRVPASRGVTYRHVLDELGVRTDLAPGESAAMVDAVGFGFYYQPRFLPAVADLLDRRERLGVRTAINTVETLANPADAAVHLGSFFHRSFAHRVIETVRESRTLDVDRVVMVQGLEGYDDLRPGTAALAEWPDDVGDVDGADVDGNDGAPVADRRIRTADYGLDVDRSALAVADVAADSAAITMDVLAGRREDHLAAAVALNAGVRIYARGDAASLDDAVAVAEDTIESGAARATLSELQAFDPPDR